MHYSKEEKAMWLEDWKQSGKQAWAYARENGIIPQTFVGWVKKETRQPLGFVEVQQKERPMSQGSGILIEKGELRVHIPLGLGSEELRAVIEGLGTKL